MNACFNERMFLSETVQISALKLSHFPDFGLYWLQEKKEMQNQNFRFGFTFHLEKCIHKNIYLESEWTITDGVWIISPHMFTFLSQDCFIHKSKGSYIMQMLIRKKCSIKSENPSYVTTPWGPLSIAERKKGGCCLGMHICSIYGPSASFISPNWHIFLDLFLLLQRSIQRLFSRWGSKSLGRFVILSLATVRLIHPSTCRGDICSSADHLRLLFQPFAIASGNRFVSPVFLSGKLGYLL